MSNFVTDTPLIPVGMYHIFALWVNLDRESFTEEEYRAIKIVYGYSKVMVDVMLKKYLEALEKEPRLTEDISTRLDRINKWNEYAEEE